MVDFFDMLSGKVSNEPAGIHSFKFHDGKYLRPVDYWTENGRIYFKSGYIPKLIEEIKVMANRKWHGYDKPVPKKLWSVADNQRNRFQLNYLIHRGNREHPNPYSRYDAPLDTSIQFGRKEAYTHQDETARFFLTRRCCIAAEEMGVGKTLAAIMAMEWVKDHFPSGEPYNTIVGEPDSNRFWYAAPKAVLVAIERELRRWKSRVEPWLMTYEGLVKIMKEWEPGQKAPQLVIFDESSKIKNSTAQRSIAAKALADSVRRDWGDDAYVWLMTGTPAPRSPEDWWWQCEIACPGFLREGDIYSFRNRLAVIEQKDSMAGGSYPELVTWRDDASKCKVCGQSIEHPNHLADADIFGADPALAHKFEPGINEVELLYKRMQGLVLIKWKKDCLDLPEKRFVIVTGNPPPSDPLPADTEWEQTVTMKPSQSMLRTAKLLLASATTVIEGLTRIRELADGFQYIQKQNGVEQCSRCNGTKKTFEWHEIPDSCPRCKGQNLEDPVNQCEEHMPQLEKTPIVCPSCNEDGMVPKYDRQERIIETPKDAQLENDLEANVEVGRLVVFAGFTASVDRCVRTAHIKGWATIKLTGKGWEGRNADGSRILDTDLLSVFQDWKDKPSPTTGLCYPLVCFCADPQSGGMGLTLTAACVEIFFSNSFNGEARVQAIDRGHRPGMDRNRGLTIKDYCLLPQDFLVRENLTKKRKLELMSMGDLLSASERVT